MLGCSFTVNGKNHVLEVEIDRRDRDSKENLFRAAYRLISDKISELMILGLSKDLLRLQ
jgi:hypothetical protein